MISSVTRGTKSGEVARIGEGIKPDRERRCAAGSEARFLS
jgi:hypothetical protein